MIAETAQLIVSLLLKDEMGPGAASATQELAKTEAQATKTTSSVSGLTRASQGAHGALSHFKGAVGGLAGSVGLLGLGGGVLALTGYFRHAISSAADFSATVDRMAALTGMATTATSQFTDALGYYGLENSKIIQITGMYEKNLASLTKTKKDATKFEKDYGFSLVDSHGHVKDAQDVITSFTQYFNDKTIPAQIKAAAGAKLFGRSWQDLIPIFQQGSAEWQKQLANGYKMTDAQRAAAHAQREASKAWNDALGDFTNTVGFKLMPTLTTLAKSAADWLNDPTNQNTLLGFLDQGITLAGNLASFIGGTVIPTIKGLASAAVGFWNTIPGPLKDLLIKGFVADRTIKYLFGISLTGLGQDLIGSLLGNIGSAIAGKLGLSRGSSPSNPMYVAGGIGGGGSGSGGAGGGLGRLGTLLTVGIAAASIADLANQIGVFVTDLGHEQADLQKQADAAGTGKTPQQAIDDLAHFTASITDRGFLGIAGLIKDTVGGKQEIDALTNLGDAIVNNGKLNKNDMVRAIGVLQDAQKQAIARGDAAAAAKIGANIQTLQARLAGPLATTAANTTAIKNQPTQVSVTANTTVNSSVSTRDVQSTERTSTRWGVIVAS